MEPLSALLIIILSLSISSLRAFLSCLVRLCLLVGLALPMLARSSLVASKTSSNALGPNSYVLECTLSGGGFLNSIGSPSVRLNLGGSLSLLYCLLTLAVKVLKSLRISFSWALSAVGTNDSPLLSKSFCVSVSTAFDRLTMFSSAQDRQLGLRHCSGVCLDFICLDLSFRDGLLALLECLCVVLVVTC